MGPRDTVNPDDRFVKVGTTHIFTVVRLADLYHHPPHAVLRGDWQHKGELLMSVSALLDPKLYRRAID